MLTKFKNLKNFATSNLRNICKDSSKMGNTNFENFETFVLEIIVAY